jgi:hypothetical protein
LLVAQIGEFDCRHSLQVEQVRRQHTAMPGDDPARLVDEDRVGETEFANGPGDLGDLGIGVRARIARVGNELAGRPVDDGQIAHHHR